MTYNSVLRNLWYYNKNARSNFPWGTQEATPIMQNLLSWGIAGFYTVYPVIDSDSIATIYVHNNKLTEYEQPYYVTIDN